MKLFLASRETQGRRKTDFFSGKEGELLHTPIIECPEDEVGRKCKCKRAFIGFETGEAVSTAKVAEVDMTVEALAKLVFDKYKVGDVCPTWEEALNEANIIIQDAEPFTVGMVVERQGEEIINRLNFPSEIYIRDTLLFLIGIKDAELSELNWPAGYSKVAEINEHDLDDIYRNTQNGSIPWLKGDFVNKKWNVPLTPGAKEIRDSPGCRSLSIGDVVTQGDEVWVVQPLGFSKL